MIEAGIPTCIGIPAFLMPLARKLAAASLGLSLICIADAGAAIDLSGVETAAGSWEIALLNTERRCGMQLRADRIPNAGHVIGMPAGCRRALPILTDVGAWTVTSERKLEFGEKAGNPVLSFAPNENDALVAQGPEGETYELIATGRQRLAQANPAGAGPTRPVAAPGIRTLPAAQSPAALPARSDAPEAAPAPATPAGRQAQRQTGQSLPQPTTPQSGGPTTKLKAFSGRPSELAGRYVILREGAKDVGCMLTFNEQARGPKGSLKAQLAPACRDNGIVVFDPQGWQLDRGRIALTARKGHKANFDHHEDGTWWKDPKEGGKPLGIRKMAQ